MPRVIGTVKAIHGKAAVKKVNDQLETLKVGDVLHENEMVYALGNDSTVTLDLEGGRTLHLNGYDEVLLDSSVFAALDKGESLDVDALRQAIADGLNPEKLDETAAGNEVVGESNAGADFAVRNDGRGNVSSYLTGTEGGALGLIPEEDVTGRNTPPIAVDDSGTAVEEGSGEDYDAPVAATGNVLGNDTDDGLPSPTDLDVAGVTSNDTANIATLVNGEYIIVGKYGTLVINAETGEYIYTIDDTNVDVDALNVGDSLSESFTYTVTDGELNDQAVLTLTINGSNDAPVAVADFDSIKEAGYHVHSSTAEGNVITDAVTGDHDVDNSNIWVVSVEKVSGGEGGGGHEGGHEGNGNGNQGGEGDYGNGYGPGGPNAPTGYDFMISGKYGVLFMWENGDYVYMLKNGKEQVDSLNEGDKVSETFTYTITDGDKFATTTLTIHIEGTNDAPVAHPDEVTISEDWFGVLSIDALSNDTDVDSGDNPSNFSLVGVSVVGGIENGIAWIDQNTGTIKYIPNWPLNQSMNEGDIKTVTLNYTMSDDSGVTSTSTVTVTINGMNDTPVAVYDFASGDENHTFIINVLANDWDIDSNDNPSNFSLDAIHYSGPGTASIVNNQLVFEPGSSYDYLNAGDKAYVTIWYQMSDDSGASSWSKAVITLIGSNDAPVAVADAVTISEDRMYAVTIDALQNDTDVDSRDNPSNFKLLSVSVDGDLSDGFAWIDPHTNTIKYIPNYLANQSMNEGDTKTVTLNYTMSDDSGATSSSTVTVTIVGVNDYPIAVVDFASGDENHTFIINVLANDWDIDSNDNPSNFSLDAIHYSGPGTASIVNNQLVFEPGTDFDYLGSGEQAYVKIWYQMSDDSGAESWSLATIRLIGSNDGPIAVDDFTVADYDTYSIHVGGNGGWDGVTITAIGGELDINNGNGKIGVNSGPGDSSQVDNKGINEAVKFEFENMLQHVEVTLSSFNTAQGDNDTATWTAMLGTSVIASGTYSGGPNPTLVIDTGNLVFDTLIIGTPDGEKADFFIDSLSGSGLEINSDLTVTENGPLFIPESYLMANDSDPDGDALNIIGIDTHGTIGVVTMDADGNVTYDAAGRFDYLAAGEVATDTFVYTLSDGDLTDTATVTINIIGSSGSADNSVNIDVGCMFNYDGGEGYDTINLLGTTLEYHNPHHGNPGYYTDSPIDFDTLSSKFDNIEHLDLKDGGKTLLNITPENVAEMTDSDNYLRISGEADDKLQLNGFTLDSAASANLDGYNAYVGNFGGTEVVLHIDTDVNIIP